MAVESPHHLTLYPPHILLSNQTIMTNAIEHQSNATNTLGYRTLHPPLYTTTTETFVPMYYSSVYNDLDPLKAESDLTYSLPVSGKRYRDSSSVCPFSDAQHYASRINLVDDYAGFTFLGEDISDQIRQQQFEIDQIVARHVERVRSELEERRKKSSRKLMAALEEGITKKLRSKEEEIMKMTKLNWELEEKLKSLCIENQIWRELAQTNEETANALRNNLKQVLEQLVNSNHNHLTTTACENDPAFALADDAESCCESNNEPTSPEQNYSSSNSNNNNDRLCKSCVKAESCVLLLPCRHLCLCTVCASSVDICPICKSSKNISVHVNMC